MTTPKAIARISRDGKVAIVSIPITFAQRGGRKQIVVPAGAAESALEPLEKPNNFDKNEAMRKTYHGKRGCQRLSLKQPEHLAGAIRRAAAERASAKVAASAR